MPSIPLLVMADSIAGSSGLGRIARDLAVRIHSNLSDTFRVGSFGIGGPIASSSKFPFFNCSVMRLQQMIPLDLPAVWDDFAGKEKGVLCVIQNASWVQYLAQPELLPSNHPLRDFLLQQPFKKWLYCPIDGHLPDGTLGQQLAPILQGFDRVLGYTCYGSEVMEKTLFKWCGQSEVSTINSIPNLPHGLDSKVFYPRDRVLARQTFFSRISNGASGLPLLDNQVLLCMVATNSSRKTWSEAFQTCAELLWRGVNVFFWGHTDTLTAPPGYWNLPALAKQFGMDQRTTISTDRLSDDTMAWAYSAMDAMLATSSEGWGLPAMESLGCGLPVVGTTYAGSAEFTPPELQVKPVSYSLESPYLIQRPLHHPAACAGRVLQAINSSPDRTRSLLDPKYEWDNCWPEWAAWLQAGLKDGLKEGKEGYRMNTDSPATSPATSLATPPPTLSIIHDLNYAHHAKMDKDSSEQSPEAIAEICRLDYESYYALLQPVSRGKSLLEIGASFGRQWDVLTEWGEELAGIDLYEPEVALGRAAGKNIVVGYAEQLPFAAGSFDLVCSRHTMEHVADIPLVLSEIRRVLRPGGYVAAITPHYFPDPELSHINQLHIEEWVTQYARAGFTIVDAVIRQFNCVEAHVVARKEER